MKIIKGEWLNCADQIKSAQYETFIFINNNGSKWAGESPDDVADLLAVLEQHTLDATFENCGNFITQNPCMGVINPLFNYQEGRNEPQWIDGPRLFDVVCITQFGGNFLTLSHCFSIYTNDLETISKLTKAIQDNQQRPDYLSQKQAAA